MSKVIRIDERAIQKIVFETLKMALNESCQDEGLSNVFMGIRDRRGNNDDDYWSNLTVPEILRQALGFLAHGNAEIARLEIIKAIKILENGEK